MMAQKTEHQQARVDAIDVDAAAVAQAAANAAASPWAGRVHLHHSSLQDWAAAHTQGSYDAIISNPPFFLRSSKPAHGQRAAARHADDTLPFTDLAACAARLLAPAHGRLSVVLPVKEGQLFAAEAAAAGLQLTRLTHVYTKAADPQPKRCLMEFRHAAASVSVPASAAAACAAAAAVQPERLDVMERQPGAAATGGWAHSAQYKALTEDFHAPGML